MKSALDFTASFDKFMNAYKDWKIIFDPSQIEIFKKIYNEIFEYEKHLNNVVQNNTLPMKMLLDVKKELERQKEILDAMINNCILCNQHNVPRGTLAR